jgi:SSS family solute:Na+ symporter
MLMGFVAVYLLISVGIGLYAATRVKNTTDYVAAGRHLPLYIITATVFATWFGSETVLGISATFHEEGMRGLWSDPFGSSLCLILVGLFFVRPLYRLNLLTLGDYYRMRYGRTVEVLCSLAIVLSYLGWVSAQITALGLVFNVLSDGQVSNEAGMYIGISVVLLYTLFGGMWSVALTDFIQMTIIILGLLYIAWIAAGMAGGTGAVIAHAEAAGRFNFMPALEARDLLAFMAGILTIGFGSIPQQDVFQRFNAAKTERIAIVGSLLGGSSYFLFAFVPIFIAYSATLIAPDIVSTYMAEGQDSQMILPLLILQHMPMFAQVMFFGALLSAIMSTASGTLLAPSVTVSENILRSTFSNMTDHQFLWLNRVVVAVFSVFVLWYAMQSEESIHGMVENAYRVTLATAFVPLAIGLYWKRTTTQGALASIAVGLVVWLGLESVDPDALVPPHLAGMLAGLVAIVVFSITPQVLRDVRGHAHHLSVEQDNAAS